MKIPEMETQTEYDGWKMGQRDGMALALITILSCRGIPVPPDIHDLIYGCDDSDQIQRWVGTAATATTIDAVFTPDVKAELKTFGVWFRNDPAYWIRFGRIEGVALGLFEVLAGRGVVISDRDCERALEAFEIEAVDKWVRSALTARTGKEFLGLCLDT